MGSGGWSLIKEGGDMLPNAIPIFRRLRREEHFDTENPQAGGFAIPSSIKTITTPEEYPLNPMRLQAIITHQLILDSLFGRN